MLKKTIRLFLKLKYIQWKKPNLFNLKFKTDFLVRKRIKSQKRKSGEREKMSENHFSNLNDQFLL